MQRTHHGILALVDPSTVPPKAPSVTADAEARYRRAKLISNIGFVVGGLVLFSAIWYIIGKGTAWDPLRIGASILGIKETAAGPVAEASLDLDPIDPTVVPAIFLDEAPPPPTPVPTSTEEPTAEDRRKAELKKELDNANELFKAWKFTEAEKTYVDVIKLLPEEQALKLQSDVATMFFKAGLRFYQGRQYTQALDVLRITIHFDAKHVEAHRYLARSYRKLGQSDKAGYHERMVSKLK